MQQIDLFPALSTDIPIEYHPNFLTTREADWLFQHCQQLNWQQNQFEMFGKPLDLPRLECMYGTGTESYTYSRGKVTIQAHPWTPELYELKLKIEDFCCHKFDRNKFEIVIGNKYRNGQDSIGWHADKEPSMGKKPAIASISLGASRKFSIRSKVKGSKPTHYQLEHGSLLIMLPGCQEEFVHEIPKDPKVLTERINLTFRPYYA
ncbi:MAG TPA: alpha-ketoglutarate-dependent dioxygenase AlkB [Nostocaceae cyanobacterium]|nr:alpha-ketoglutarate-dependent dioxygenase AlkB [Nostocaceae cyanobacterium]